MTYTIAKIKTFRAMEGEGFNADLMRDGRKVAEVDDEGCGGSYHFRWLDRNAPRVTVRRRRYDGTTFECLATPEEARFLAYVEAQPPFTVEGDTLKASEETVIGAMVDREMNLRRYRRGLKTSVYVLQGGKVYGYKRSEGIEARIVRKHPDAQILATPEAVVAAMEASQQA